MSHACHIHGPGHTGSSKVDDKDRRTGVFPMEQFARIGIALSSPQRLRLVALLAQAERTVEDLAKVMGLSIASTSQHLRAPC